MQVEKHLFRISERTMKHQNTAYYFNCVLSILIVVSLIFTILFIFGHAFALKKNSHLSQCIQISRLELVNDEVYFVTDQNIPDHVVEQYKAKNQIKWDNEECIVIKNLLNTKIQNAKNLLFAWDREVFKMNVEMRTKLKYDNYTIYLKKINSVKKTFYGLDSLLANELLSNPLNVFPHGSTLYARSQNLIFGHDDAVEMTAWKKMSLMGMCIIYYLVVSVMTSLYIYGTIVAAPSVIIMFLKWSNYIRNDNMNDIYKIFPWIGIHSLVRETSESQKIRQSSGQICKAILLYFLFLYGIYYTTIVWVDQHLFIQHGEIGLQEMLFGYVALVEFAAIIFMRTRSFIRYFPIFHSFLILLFLFYGQFCQFGFKKLAFSAVCCISASFFCWNILKFELPAQNVWDRNDKSTPTIDRPRIGMFPLFNMNWVSNLPDEWSLMVPMCGRQNFEARQMAFIDKNYEELGNILSTNNVVR